jgi:nucleotide-binding universal stress UspA family protein
MNNVSKILVFIDLSGIDSVLIKYASFLADLLEVREVYFVHAYEYDELPYKLRKEFPELDEPLGKLIEDEMTEKVNRFFTSEKAEPFIKIMENAKIVSILQWAETEQIDLMLLGKKISFRGKGNFAAKVTKLAHCSVMLVPETSRFEISKIIVPIDFSEYSGSALKKAIQLSDKTNAEIVCQNVYRMPPHFFPYISKRKEELDGVRKEVQQKFKKFISNIGGKAENLKCECSIDHENDVAEDIYRFSVEQQADMIVVGYKGKTDAMAFFLGGVTERLIRNDKNVSVFVVKDKEKTKGVLKSLLKMT